MRGRTDKAAPKISLSVFFCQEQKIDNFLNVEHHVVQTELLHKEAGFLLRFHPGQCSSLWQEARCLWKSIIPYRLLHDYSTRKEGGGPSFLPFQRPDILPLQVDQASVCAQLKAQFLVGR